MSLYYGYVIGQDVTCEQVERLHNFFNACYTPKDLNQLKEDELNIIAELNKREWW